jgi:hypothetical protein
METGRKKERKRKKGSKGGKRRNDKDKKALLTNPYCKLSNCSKKSTISYQWLKTKTVRGKMIKNREDGFRNYEKGFLSSFSCKLNYTFSQEEIHITNYTLIKIIFP